MPGVVKNDLGKIVITEDIIETIAGNATVENYGIVGMAGKKASDGIWELLKRENIRKGVRAITTDQGIVVDLYVMVEYGVSINAVAENVIQNVGYKVSDCTGLHVSSVNVHVEGVRVQSV